MTAQTRARRRSFELLHAISAAMMILYIHYLIVMIVYDMFDKIYI